ncbi:MAG: secondary thiamine-phosphate synthase enzyme YjbQ [Vicinamibacterales bacterium]
MPAVDTPAGLLSRQVVFSIATRSPFEFVDITAMLARTVDGCGLREGVVHVQTRHTTTAVLINEHEPLLLEDLRNLFDRLVPSAGPYLHDDFSQRIVNVLPGERVNGAAHCRAALLRASESVTVTDGRLNLGRWQRVFVVEFDGPQSRDVSVSMLGTFWRTAGTGRNPDGI